MVYSCLVQSLIGFFLAQFSYKESNLQNITILVSTLQESALNVKTFNLGDLQFLWELEALGIKKTPI